MTVVEVKRRSDELDLTETDDFIESHLDSFFPTSEKIVEEESELEAENEELKAREDASLDFDNDTLTNVEEYSLSGENDSDKDGIPNIYDSDDDEDGLSTSLEERYNLDPYDPSDAESDLDNDGLSNIFEHQNNLSLNREDSDSDGIIDGAEYDYWREEGFSQNVSIKYCKKPDVDGDNITDVQDCHPSILGIPADGKEINGYDAKVITGWTDDGEPISELRTVDNRDPLVAYSTESGEWSDTDSDGIPDVVESWFSNASIATNDSYRQNFVDRWPDLYENYSWVKDYFETVKEEENETKAEQWLTDQFNTMVREKTPPMVTKFTAEFYWDTSGTFPDLKVWTHVKARDVGGIDEIELKDLDNGESYSPDTSDSPTSIEFTHEFDTTLWTAGVGSVELNLSATDSVGNVIYAEEEVKGAIGQALEALGEIWSAIAGVLSGVAEAVAEAVSVVVDWLLSKVKEIADVMIAKIKNGIKNYIRNIASSLQCAVNQYKNESSIDSATLMDVGKKIYGSNFVLGLVATLITLKAVTYILLPFKPVISGLIGLSVAVIGIALLKAFGAFGENISADAISMDIFGNLSNIAEKAKELTGVGTAQEISEGFVIALLIVSSYGWIEISGKFMLASFVLALTSLALSGFAHIIDNPTVVSTLLWLGLFNFITTLLLAWYDMSRAATSGDDQAVYVDLTTIFMSFMGIVWAAAAVAEYNEELMSR